MKETNNLKVFILRKWDRRTSKPARFLHITLGRLCICCVIRQNYLLCQPGKYGASSSTPMPCIIYNAKPHFAPDLNKNNFFRHYKLLNLCYSFHLCLFHSLSVNTLGNISYLYLFDIILSLSALFCLLRLL